MSDVINSKLHFKLLRREGSLLDGHDTSIIDEDVDFVEGCFLEVLYTFFNASQITEIEVQ
jgi:hypothetical protein